jgi:hypothetical protein
MTTGFALILLCLALAMILAAGLTLPSRHTHPNRPETGRDSGGRVESELLRRPLRSRYTA